MAVTKMIAADIGLTEDGKIDIQAMSGKELRRWIDQYHNLDSIGVRDEHYPFRPKEKDH